MNIINDLSCHLSGIIVYPYISYTVVLYICLLFWRLYRQFIQFHYQENHNTLSNQELIMSKSV